MQYSVLEVHLSFKHICLFFFHISFVRSYSYFYYLFVKYSQELLWVFRILLFFILLLLFLLLLLLLFFGQRVAKISMWICVKLCVIVCDFWQSYSGVRHKLSLLTNQLRYET